MSRLLVFRWADDHGQDPQRRLNAERRHRLRHGDIADDGRRRGQRQEVATITVEQVLPRQRGELGAFDPELDAHPGIDPPCLGPAGLESREDVAAEQAPPELLTE
jgi:hypothetical protein